jgi:uncharacterized protein YciI
LNERICLGSIRSRILPVSGTIVRGNAAVRKTYYVLSFTPGEAWVPGKSIFKQPLDDHVAYLREFHRCGKLLLAGPFLDSSGGMTILDVATEEEARRILEDDPDVKRKVIKGTVRAWSPIPFAEMSG